MNTAKWLPVVVSALAFCRLSAAAGEQYQFSFHGTCYQTNEAGAITSTAVTEQTLLQDLASAVGITDVSGMTLVYHAGANGMGDTVDVINASNGAVLSTLYGFYFSEAFGRMALTNRTGTVQKRVQYVYTDQNDHSLGGGLVTRTMVRRSGDTHPMFQGTIHYLVTPQGTKGTRVYNGTFTTGKLLFVDPP